MKITIEDSLLKSIRSRMREFQRCVGVGINRHKDDYGCDDACFAVGDFAREIVNEINAAIRSQPKKVAGKATIRAKVKKCDHSKGPRNERGLCPACNYPLTLPVRKSK